MATLNCHNLHFSIPEEKYLNDDGPEASLFGLERRVAADIAEVSIHNPQCNEVLFRSSHNCWG